jgi:hypothetical protein
MFPLGTRSGEAVDQFFERLQNIVVDGARQLDKSIDHLMNGQFEAIGVDPRIVRRILPVVVSLQEIILNPLLRDWIDTEISTAGYLTREKVRRATVLPLQVLGVGDLETLELLVELGKGTPVQLLLAALRDQFGKDQSFATWAWKRYPDVTQSRARLAYHAEQFETLTKRASAYYNP